MACSPDRQVAAAVSQARLQLEVALRGLAYVANWAHLDGPETDALGRARAAARRRAAALAHLTRPDQCRGRGQEQAFSRWGAGDGA